MFPIHDAIRSRHAPWITRALVIANGIVFFLELRQGPAIEGFLYRFGVVPSHWLVTSPNDLLYFPQLFLTLVTSQFLHGGFFHLISNLWYLWIFADNVEDCLRPSRFLFLYIGSGVVAALVHMFISPTSSIPMVGASGAIAGVLGAYLVLFPSARVVTVIPLGFFWRTIQVPAFVFLGIWFLLQWFQGLLSIGQVADVGGVAFWAHVGGFISGMLFIWIWPPKRRW